ncbi:MAG: hypothetical protein J6Q03_00055, partial [Paludibacteraceae bacterium]|nr:hypothetical protein [Paludibacteraceae bacterium]
MGTEKKIRRALFTILLSIIAVTTHAATLTTSQQSACVDESVKIEVTDLSGVEYVDFKRSTDNGSTWTNVGRAVVKNGKAEITDFMTTEEPVYKVFSYPGAADLSVQSNKVTLKTTDCPKSSSCHTTSSGDVFDGTDFSVVDKNGTTTGSGFVDNIESFLPENHITLSNSCSNAFISNSYETNPESFMANDTNYYMYFSPANCGQPLSFRFQQTTDERCCEKDNNNKCVNFKNNLCGTGRYNNQNCDENVPIWNHKYFELRMKVFFKINCDNNAIQDGTNIKMSLSEGGGVSDCFEDNTMYTEIIVKQNNSRLGYALVPKAFDMIYLKDIKDSEQKSVKFTKEYVYEMDISIYGKFDLRNNANQKQFVTVKPEFGQWGNSGCVDFAVDYISLESESLCLSSNTSCLDQDVAVNVNALGFSERANFIWQKKNDDGTWSTISEYSGVGKGHADVKVTEVGLKEFRVFVDREGGEINTEDNSTYDQLFDFYIVGKYCDVSLIDINGESSICLPTNVTEYDYEAIQSVDNDTVNYSWIVRDPDGNDVTSSMLTVDSGDSKKAKFKIGDGVKEGEYKIKVFRAYKGEDGDGGAYEKTVTIGKAPQLGNDPVALNYCTESAPSEDEVIAHIKKTIGDNYEVTVADYNGADGAYTYTATANGCSANGTVEVAKLVMADKTVDAFSYCTGSFSRDALLSHIKNKLGDGYEISELSENGNPYTFKIKETSSGCSTNGTVTVTEISLPSGTLDNLSYCSGSEAPTLPTTLGDYNVVYEGDGETDGNVTTYSYRLVTTTAPACSSDVQTFTVTKLELPGKPSQTVFKFCAESDVNTTILADSVKKYVTVPEGKTYDITVTEKGGTYTYVIKDNATNCEVTGDLTIERYAKPTAPEVTISNYCYGTEGTLPTLPSGVSWVGGEPDVSASVSAGTHGYSYRFTDNNGCVSDDVTKSFTVHAKPEISVAFTQGGASVGEVCPSNGGDLVVTATVTNASNLSGTFEYIYNGTTNASASKTLSYDCSTSTVNVIAQVKYTPETNLVCVSDKVTLAIPFADKPDFACAQSQPTEYTITSGCSTNVNFAAPTYKSCKANAVKSFVLQTKQKDDSYKDSVTAQTWDNISHSLAPGSYKAIFTVEDLCLGENNKCEREFTVVDGVAPTIDCADKTIVVNTDKGECSAEVTLTPEVSDNCGIHSVNATLDGSAVTLLNNTFTATLDKGTHTVLWTVTDVNGKNSECKQTVTVEDKENPVISGISDIEKVSCEASGIVISNPTATDNCDVTEFSVSNDNSDKVTVSMDADGNVSYTGTFPIGTTTIKWTAKDEAGNTTTVDQTVTVTDGAITLPEITPMNYCSGTLPTAAEAETYLRNQLASANVQYGNDLKVTITAGVYNFSFTNEHGCPTSGVLKLNELPLPAAPKTDFTYCPESVVSAGLLQSEIVNAYTNASAYEIEVKNVSGDKYSYTVKNKETNCATSGEFVVKRYAKPTAPTVTINPFCENLAAASKPSLPVSGAGDFSGYTINWTEQPNADLTKLGSGSHIYKYTVTDGNNCVSAETSFTVEVYATPTAPKVENMAFCENASDKPSLPVSEAGDFAGYTINWTEQPNADLTKLGSGSHIYKYTVTDGNNCVSAETSFTVEVYA